MIRRGTRARFGCIAMALAFMASGCSSPASKPTSSSGSKPASKLASGPNDAAKAGAEGAEDDASSRAPVADGLETLLWVADDTGGAIGRKLAPYLVNKPPVDAKSAERLRLMGLRAVAVPLKELDQLRASLEAAGPTQRRWLGQLPDWTVLVEGNNYPSGVRVSTGSKRLDLDAGRLRWLVRSWTTPVTIVEEGQTRIAAALHVELVPQVQEFKPKFDRMLEQAARDGALTLRSTGPERDGPLVDDATIRFELATTDVLVLAPESPDVDWLATLEPSDQTGRTEPDKGGPSKPRTPTIGEAMLAQDTQAGGRVKVVVALIPRLPAQFRLLGR